MHLQIRTALRLLTTAAGLVLASTASQAVESVRTQPPVIKTQATGDSLESLMPERPPVNYNSVNGTIKLFNSTLIYPLPDWTPLDRSKNPLASTKFIRQSEDDLFHMEMIPINEDKKDWSNRYSITAQKTFPGSIRDHARQIIGKYRTPCQLSNFQVRPGKTTPNKAVLYLVCGNFVENRDEGLVAAFVLFKNRDNAIRLYREWKGPAFRSEDPSQWPVSREDFRRIFNTIVRADLARQR